MNLRPKNQPAYGESVQKLISETALSNYATGSTHDESRQILGELSVQDLFDGEIVDTNLAKCCLSGLWLVNNFLHESHEISQSIETPEGSLWHAIMHRLEGDFWNSKYWYRRAGDHPSFSKIGADWDPQLFVDDCEADPQSSSRSGSELHQLACSEWQALFDYCWTGATSTND